MPPVTKAKNKKSQEKNHATGKSYQTSGGKIMDYLSDYLCKKHKLNQFKFADGHEF
ncbi:hypothetical protein S225a_14020 [Candidatus Brocadiaceae bacterium S225]|nr:hypothetical protein S225a_14020 [Candidatus Brocadiaceae bacterium S225]